MRWCREMRGELINVRSGRGGYADDTMLAEMACYHSIRHCGLEPPSATKQR